MSASNEKSKTADKQAGDIIAAMTDPASWLDAVNTAMAHMPGQLPDFGPFQFPTPSQSRSKSSASLP